MIDFESYRPSEVAFDSRELGWDGFRVVQRINQAPAELDFSPGDMPPSDGAAGDYLISLNEGLAGQTGLEADGRWFDLTGSRQNWILHPAALRARYVWSSHVNSAHLLLSQGMIDEVGHGLGLPSARRVDLPPMASPGVPGYVQRLRHFVAAAASEDAGSRLRADVFVRSFVVHLLDGLTDVTAGRRRRVERLNLINLRRIEEFIDARLSDKIGLQDLSRLTGMSAYHFARAFRNTTSFAPHQYVLARRLERSRGLLLHSDASVTDVALACGFASSSHFGEAFRRRYRVTPTQLRLIA